MPLTTLTRFRACPDAQWTWLRVLSILRVYWTLGKKWPAKPSGGWCADAKVQGGERDAMEALEFAVSADMALNALRKQSPKAFVVACKDIEEPMRPYHTDRGMGVADLLRVSTEEALEMLERAKEYVWWLLEREGSPPIDSLW